MKNSVLFIWMILLILAHIDIKAQPNYFRSGYQVGGEGTMLGLHVNTFDGGMALLSRSGDTLGNTFMNLEKLDLNGNVQWTRRISVGMVYLINLVQSPDSSLFFCVQVDSIAAGAFYIFRFSANGNLIFQKELSLPAGYVPVNGGAALARNNGGFYVAALAHNISSVPYYWFVTALSDSGTVQWSTMIFPFNSLATGVYAVDSFPNGDPLILGWRMYNVNTGDRPVLARLDQSNGNLMWAGIYAYTSNIVSPSITHDSSGNFYVAGRSDPTSPSGLVDALVMKLDTAGNLMWTKRYANSSRSLLGTFVTTGLHNSIVVTGFAAQTVEGFAFEIDTSGNVQWARTYDNAWPMSSVRPYNGSGYSLNGITSAAHPQNFIITVDSLGLGCDDVPITLTATPATLTWNPLTDSAAFAVIDHPSFFVFSSSVIARIPGCSPETVPETPGATMHIYPNPAHDYITIESQQNILQVEVYDMQGRILCESVPRGNVCQVNLAGLACGMYLLNVTDQNGTYQRPIIVDR